MTAEEDFERLPAVLAALPREALLQPVWNTSSPKGFYYPGATPDEPILHPDSLEWLADKGYAERVFVDRLSLCPNCESHALNVHDICSACGSSNVVQFTALFHFRCGYVGPTETFREEREGLRCPKCRRILAGPGTDHDSPGTYFRCLNCTGMFQIPEVGARCLSCGCRFDQRGMQNVKQRDVFAYRITELGLRAIDDATGRQS
ncbi:MAG TPA: hypothetical protein VME66_08205 [Candidatus Acidoferrales bacterium]|nr:hypothetical protein [Candidatus Acidoferrales bacterium]